MVLSERELQQLHSILLSIMLEFDTVCRRNDIKYFLGGGTLLGAIRHGGFIPWDDDVDLMMTRENYDKLCSLPQEEFEPHLFLQTFRTDSFYHGDMAKIRLNGTKYVTEFSSRFPEMHQGIFIDIFAHDVTASSRLGQRLHIFLTALCRSMVFHKWDQSPMQDYGKHSLICKMATFFVSLVPMVFLENLRERTLLLFAGSRSGMLYDGIGMHLKHGAFPAEWLTESSLVDFDGHLFPVPREYDKYLTFSYGEYMKVPQADERKQHILHEIYFNNHE